MGGPPLGGLKGSTCFLTTNYFAEVRYGCTVWECIVALNLRSWKAIEPLMRLLDQSVITRCG